MPQCPIAGDTNVEQFTFANSDDDNVYSIALHLTANIFKTPKLICMICCILLCHFAVTASVTHLRRFLLVRRCSSAVLARALLVCLSVCLSVHHKLP